MTLPLETRPIGDRLLSWRAVRDLTGVSRTTLWRLQKAGKFPQPVRISAGRVGWREQEVIAWAAGLSPTGAPGPASEPGTTPGPARPPDAPKPPLTQVEARSSSPTPIRRPQAPAAPVSRRGSKHAITSPSRQMSFDF